MRSTIVSPLAASAVNRMPFACSGSFSRRWKMIWLAGSNATSCSPSSFTVRCSPTFATRRGTWSTSTVAGSSPSRPRMTARSLPWPLPVKPRLPNSSIFTLAVPASWPSCASRSANRRAARIGPTVCEDDGPMPILKISKTEMCTARLEQDTGADARRPLGDVFLDVLRDVLIEVLDEIADVRIGREQLRADVRAHVGDDLVDIAEDARHVLVNVEDPVRAARHGQLDLREVHRAAGRPGVDELDQRRRDLAADRLLILLGRPADMGRQDHVR